MVLEVMYIWRLTLANLSQTTVNTNISDNDYKEAKDDTFSLQEDLKDLSLTYQSSENRLYSAIAKSTAYTLTNSDNVILVSAGTSLTMTLPSSVGRRGKQFIIKDSSGAANTNNINIVTTSSQTIDGVTSKIINTAYGKFWIVSDNANYFILGT